MQLNLFRSSALKVFLFLTCFVLFLLASFIDLLYDFLNSLSNGDVTGNYYKFFNNYLPLIFAGMLGPGLLLPCTKNTVLRTLLVILPLSMFFALLIDNAAFSLFRSRFYFADTFLFLPDLDIFVLFFKEFIYSVPGLLIIISLFFLLASLFLLLKTKRSIKPVYNLAVVAGFALWGFSSQEPLFYESIFQNVFQINGISFNVQRELKFEFSKEYNPRKVFDYRWKSSSGLNQRKNLIVLVVESLDCSLVSACSEGLSSSHDLMPYLTSLSKENLNFVNYYSNNSTTYGAYVSITKSLPSFSSILQTDNEEQLGPYSSNDLIKIFSESGYRTVFFSPCDFVYGMKEILNNYAEVYTSDDPFYKDLPKRYLFNGVPDRDLYSLILNRLKTQKGPFLYFVQTIITHKPYNSPLADRDLVSAYRYADAQIAYLVDELERLEFFSNGILVITGDHHHWPADEDGKFGPAADFSHNVMEEHRVPLLIVDGQKEHRVNQIYMSHSSLGVYLQSLMLPAYISHKFNADPVHSQSPELIVHYENLKQNYITVKYGAKEDIIVVNGDNSFFVYHVFDHEFERDILGFVSNCR